MGPSADGRRAGVYRGCCVVSEHPSCCRTTPARLEIYSHPRSRTSTYRRVRFGDIESALSPLLGVLRSPRGYHRAALRFLLLLSSSFLLHRYLPGSIIRSAALRARAHALLAGTMVSRYLHVALYKSFTFPTYSLIMKQQLCWRQKQVIRLDMSDCDLFTLYPIDSFAHIYA